MHYEGRLTLALVAELLAFYTQTTAGSCASDRGSRGNACTASPRASSSSSATPHLSTPFPSGHSSRNEGFRVSRVGFGSPWLGARPTRMTQLSTALSDGRCNLVQLSSKITPFVATDEKGNPVEHDAESPDDSWEARVFRHDSIPRKRLALLLSLDAEGLTVEEALNPSRAMEQLDKLLQYHGIEWLDAFLLEIPPMKGGEAEVNTYRREMGLAVQKVMREVVAEAGSKMSTLGFSWQINPHVPYPGRAPDSPLSDVIELRDMLMPNKPLVAMFPVGVGCGAILDGWKAAPGGRFGLPRDQGVFQIGTKVLHTQRPDGRPFRFVDVKPRPIDEIMAELKAYEGNRLNDGLGIVGQVTLGEIREMFDVWVLHAIKRKLSKLDIVQPLQRTPENCFAMTIHLELEYKKRFETQHQPGGGFEDAGGEGQGDDSKAGENQAGENQGGDSKEGENTGGEKEEGGKLGPLPHKADVCWAHILLQHQHQIKGLDEWETIRDTQIKPTVDAAVQTLRAAGQAPSEWGFLYRNTLASLLFALTETMEHKKMHQLKEASALMDELCPSLPTMARGASQSGNEEQQTSASGETVMARCVSAALATGVDCVLSEEFATSREPGRYWGFEPVDSDTIAELYKGFKLPQ